ISALHFLTPINNLVFHQIYQRLYYIPIILAAFWYGWRGGLGAALFACISYVPHISMHWQHQNYDYALNQYAEIAKTEVERIDKLVQEFFHFARAKKPDRQPTDINELVRSVKLLIEHQAKGQKVEIVEVLAEKLPLVSVDAEQIKQVLLNLAINSLQAMSDGGKLIFHTFEKDDKLFIETEDTGGGIDEQVKSKIFDPFFTTKEKGLGLGLSVVYKIISQHNGRILFFNTVGGTLASITFSQSPSGIEDRNRQKSEK
ncbi:MAG: ATP-binding protein, partial [Pyrinomonadaceae bacterium]